MEGLTILPPSERQGSDGYNTAIFNVATVPKPFDRPLPVGTTFHTSEGGFRIVHTGQIHATDAEIESGKVSILYAVERITEPLGD
ncbi:hypothetical protein [Streptomyces graminilatus]|uniref:hypothetical protein n=1 Tax=Streptomyces graminilatus TaxID=1464070 RepID=UPI0006E3958D|nr:hypothetical protein [Streptomyces graminilatus]